jgi:hypothetical protein
MHSKIALRDTHTHDMGRGGGEEEEEEEENEVGGAYS